MTEQKIIKSQRKSKIKIGDKFTRWTVLENLGIIKGRTRFRCECECGKIRNVIGYELYSGHSKSCGCFNKDRILKHGMCGTATYRTWQHMLSRCNNSKNDNYQDYGGRGIMICDHWLKFENFFADMGTRSEGLTIERKNNNLGYFKENCCWASSTMQSRNTRLFKTNTSGVKGVSWNNLAKKYQAYINVNNKMKHLGFHKTIEQAKVARVAGEQKYWKQET